MEKFDPVSYINTLPIEKVEKLIRNGKTVFRIHVRNKEGFSSTFIATSMPRLTTNKLIHWRSFRNLFLKHAGIEIPEIPNDGRKRKGRKPALIQVVRILREKSFKGGRCYERV